LEVKIMSSKENLMEAFAGESQANRKYLAFAKKADDEGFSQVAKLFRAAAAAETVHAHNHLEIAGGINDTEANLKDAIEGETFEFTTMYPNFIAEAKAEKEDGARWTFDVANSVEQIHADLYKNALENLGKNSDIDYYVCALCGNTVENEAPEKCPICGAENSDFMKID
jgi:rubrerythrin